MVIKPVRATKEDTWDWARKSEKVPELRARARACVYR